MIGLPLKINAIDQDPEKIARAYQAWRQQAIKPQTDSGKTADLTLLLCSSRIEDKGRLLSGCAGVIHGWINRNVRAPKLVVPRQAILGGGFRLAAWL